MPERYVDLPEFEQIAAGVLAAGSTLRFTARGSSMRPFIRDGDAVEVQAVAPGQVRRGQVVLCRLANGRLVVHRVLRVTGCLLLVQGDALLHPDGSVPANHVIGRVIAVTHGARRTRQDSPAYQGLVRAWLWLTPLRRLVFRLARFFHLQKLINAFFA